LTSARALAWAERSAVRCSSSKSPSLLSRSISPSERKAPAGRAIFDAPAHDVNVRYAERDGKIYVDLADESWSAVEITRTGWRIVDEPPVRFLRTGGMTALPMPERGGTLLDLRPFLNATLDADEEGDSEEPWRLLVGWLLG
jgi:hypothetical protein